MVLPSPAGKHRHTLADARDDGRRMEVTWHREAGVVVLSLWQGETCRSTFRMPIEEAPMLIASLSSALGDAVSMPRFERSAGIVARRSSLGRAQIVSLLRRWVRRSRADVVRLRPVRQPTETE